MGRVTIDYEEWSVSIHFLLKSLEIARKNTEKRDEEERTFFKGKNYLVIISGTESGGVELGLSKKRGFEKVD